MRAIVTGAAGFIGSHLCDFLLEKKMHVLGLDHLSTGKLQFLEKANVSKKFQFLKHELMDEKKTKDVFLDFQPDLVFHLAANADVRFGLKHPKKDIEQGTLVTFHVLEASRHARVKRIFYSSTGSVYGEPTVFPTPENAPFPIQTSLYASSKLSGESLLTSYALGFGIQATIFRFVSILGPRYSHGHVFDFIQKLKKDPSHIDVLGNGLQKKAYLHVQDCMNAIWTIYEKDPSPIHIYNLGPDEYVNVNDSLSIICEKLGVHPQRKYSGGDRGWVGDSPFIFLDCSRLKQLGWKAQYSISEGVKDTVDYLLKNEWLFQDVQSTDNSNKENSFL